MQGKNYRRFEKKGKPEELPEKRERGYVCFCFYDRKVYTFEHTGNRSSPALLEMFLSYDSNTVQRPVFEHSFPQDIPLLHRPEIPGVP